MGARMDIMDAMHRIEQTGECLTSYGSNLDKLMLFIRDSENRQFVEKMLRQNGLMCGRLIGQLAGDNPFRGHMRGILISHGAGQHQVFLLGADQSKKATRGLPPNEFRFFSHPKGFFVLCSQFFSFFGEKGEISLRGENPDWVNDICSVNPDGTVFIRNKSEVCLLELKGESFDRLAFYPRIENLSEVKWAARRADGELVFLCVSDADGWVFASERGWQIWRNLYFPPIFYGMSSLGLVIAWRPDLELSERVVYVEGKERYRSDWQNGKVCWDGFIVREGKRLILNGERIIYYGSFKDWDICPGVKAVVVREEVMSGVYEFRQIFY